MHFPIIDYHLLNIVKIVKKKPDAYTEIGQELYDLQQYMKKSKMSKTERLGFSERYHSELMILFEYLNDKRFTNVILENNKEVSLLSFQTTLIVNQFLYNEYLNTISDKVNVVCREFMKGITYFKGRDISIDRPIYHRTTSCGIAKKNNAQYVKDNLNCTNVADNTDEFERRRLNVRNCLIERMVYDQIYQRFHLVNQNIGHLVQILDVDRVNFQSCFPGSVLQMHQIEFLNKLPVSLTIEISNSNKTIVEHYKKELNSNNEYMPDVVCTRSIVDKETHVKIQESKIQSFDAEQLWKGQRYFLAGGDKRIIKVLGRKRRIHKIGLKNMVQYKGQFISLSEARKQEKQIMDKKNNRNIPKI